MVVLGLAIDTGSRSIDVIKVTFDLSTRIVDCREVVVRLEELLVLNNGSGVTIDRGVFVRAYVPDDCCGTIGGSGCGEGGGFEPDRNITIKGCHGFFDAANHLIDTGREERDGCGRDCCRRGE